MLHKICKLAVCACLALAGVSEMPAAQSAEAKQRPQFEVASVKPARPPWPPTMPVELLASVREREEVPRSLPMPGPGRVRIQQWSLLKLVAGAFGVQKSQVSGPAWMDDAYFEIDAKLPDGARPEQGREMLQTLLAERFGLELHREKREVRGFALVVGKHGAKLEEYVPPAPGTAPGADVGENDFEGRRRQFIVAGRQSDGDGVGGEADSKCAWAGSR